MTKKLDGALFEEPAVVVGCPDYRLDGKLMSGLGTVAKLTTLYGGIPARGRWKGEDEACIIFPLSGFARIIRCSTDAASQPLRKHLQTEECIAVFYRLPRNPQVTMCGMRKPPKLFAPAWGFIQNEDTDKIAVTAPDTGQDGLIIGDNCISSTAQA